MTSKDILLVLQFDWSFVDASVASNARPCER